MTSIPTTFFTGVNAGYAQDAAVIDDHAEAMTVATGALSFIKRNRPGDQNAYQLYPARVIYDPNPILGVGCPPGGEIAVAVTTDASLGKAVRTAEQLREALDQSSLSVAGAPENGSPDTVGFKMEVQGNLKEIAQLWQEKASRVKADMPIPDGEAEIYVSAGMYDKGNGTVVIQGEANPRYFPTSESREVWKEAAGMVAQQVAGELHQECKPELREMGFHYLRAQGKANSRGELN